MQKTPSSEDSIVIKGLLNHPIAFAEDRQEEEWETGILLQNVAFTLGLDFQFISKRWFRYRGERPSLNPSPAAVFLQFKNSYQKERFVQRLSLLSSSPYASMKLRVYNYFPPHVRGGFQRCQEISYFLRKVKGIKKVHIRMEDNQLKVFYENEGQIFVQENKFS